jgi:Flp pilus assembly pilin Flp
VSPPVKDMDGANAVDGAGDVVAVVAVVVAAVVEGVVGELEHAADRTTHRRIPGRETGITRA